MALGSLTLLLGRRLIGMASPSSWRLHYSSGFTLLESHNGVLWASCRTSNPGPHFLASVAFWDPVSFCDPIIHALLHACTASAVGDAISSHGYRASVYTVVAELGRNLTHFAAGMFHSGILYPVFLLQMNL